MKNIRWLLIWIVLLVACSSETPMPTESIQEPTATAAPTEILTEILTDLPTDLPTEVPTEAPPGPAEVSASSTPQPTVTVSAFQDTGKCLHARFVSETIPDNTVLQPGEAFVKTWSLQNVGNCIWTEEVSLVFDHGAQFGGLDRIPLTGWVRPGESVSLSLELTAPEAQGSFIGFWFLEGADGTLFGVGEEAGIPLWAQILVPGPEPTPVVVTIGYSIRGTVRSNGNLEGGTQAGDTGGDQTWQAFATFDLKNVPAGALVQEFSLGFAQAIQIEGDPFGSLGCLDLYLDTYDELDADDFVDIPQESPIASFCSLEEMRLGAVLEPELADGIVQIRFQFEDFTDNDGARDLVDFNPWVQVTFTFQSP